MDSRPQKTTPGGREDDEHPGVLFQGKFPPNLLWLSERGGLVWFCVFASIMIGCPFLFRPHLNDGLF